MKLQEIKIKGLYKEWNLTCKLDPRVTIIAGINGSFKSTFLRIIRDLLKSKKSVQHLITGAEASFTEDVTLFYKHFEDSLLSLKKVQDDELLKELATQVQLDLTNVDEKTLSERILKADIAAFKEKGKKLSLKQFEAKCKFDMVSTFDMPQIEAGPTYLDSILKDLESAYAYYLSDLAKAVTESILSEGSIAKEKLDKIYYKNNLFLQIMNDSLGITGKVIDSRQSKLTFRQGEEALESKSLSSGEKQLLIVLLTVLLERDAECILLMDEPEISMHFEWQRKLIGHILLLNPNCQIILTSHSPAIIMDGWEQFVLNMDDIKSRMA